MTATPVSLLERARRGEDADWRRLVALYTPLLNRWMAGWSVQPADADDVLQDVFGVLLRELPAFRHEGRPGAFRHWLRGVLVNRLRGQARARRDHARPVGGPDLVACLAELEDPESELSSRWDAEHDRHVMARLLELIRPEFTAPTWQAFCRQALDGAAVAEVAAELGLSANAICIARSRVLRRLREEASGLLDG